MISIGVVFLQVICCIGLGASVLTVLRIQKDLPVREQWTWSFAIGFGVLGWLLFFFGLASWFTTIPLIVLLCIGSIGICFLWMDLRTSLTHFKKPSFNGSTLLIIAALIFIVVIDLFEGLSPPADGDSLAYHFVHPKNFLAANMIEFVPRGGDGSIPMVIHMSYVTTLGLGGEKALTLWTMITGWASAALFYSIARKFLDLKWSLFLMLIFITTPAVIYGAGSGQVEVKMSLFAMVAGTAVMLALKTKLIKYTILAGIAAGFVMGSKFLGLLFVATCGIVVIAQRKWFIHGLTFSLAALIAGGQWYVWNYINSGDPVFPVLFEWLKHGYHAPWDENHANAFKQMFVFEKSVPINFIWFLAYPFAATFSIFTNLESGRTGLGPFIVLIIPFVLAAIWTHRTRILQSSLLPIAAIIFIFYALWFFTGSSQRVRHLLPVYPLLLICISAVAIGWAHEKKIKLPILGAILLTLSIQLAGYGLFGMSYAKHIFLSESKNDFLQRTVNGYVAIPWINKNIKSPNRIYTQERQLIYYFKVPVYYGHWSADAKIDTRPETKDYVKLYKQLRGQKITHLLTTGSIDKKILEKLDPSGYGLWRTLYLKGCLKLSKSFKGYTFRSRTLKSISQREKGFHVFELQQPKCLA